MPAREITRNFDFYRVSGEFFQTVSRSRQPLPVGLLLSGLEVQSCARDAVAILLEIRPAGLSVLFGRVCSNARVNHVVRRVQRW